MRALRDLTSCHRNRTRILLRDTEGPMKLTPLITMFLFLSAFSATGNAQDVCPEYANEVNAIIKGGTAGIALGLEDATVKQKKKGLYRGWDSSIRLSNSNAKIAFKKSTTPPAFSFKPVNEAVNPRQQIKLYAMTSQKTYRELSVGGMNNWGGTKDKKSKDSSIELKFEKISKGCYKVTAAVELPAGQYAFSLGAAPDVQGTTAGWATSSQGQVWFGFSLK